MRYGSKWHADTGWEMPLENHIQTDALPDLTRSLMKSIAYGMALAAVVSAPVLAAEMPLKAPNAAAVVSGWIGAYVGLELGGRLSDAAWTTKSIQEIGVAPPRSGGCLIAHAFPNLRPPANGRLCRI